MYMLVGPASPEAKEEGLAPRPSAWTGPSMGPYKTAVAKVVETSAQELLYDIPKQEEPLQVTCKIGKCRNDLSAGMEAWNPKRFDFTPLLNLNDLMESKDDRRVWIYNVSRLTYRIYHPIIKTPLWGNITKKRYTMCMSLPAVVVMPKGDLDSMEVSGLPVSGARLAMDLINPDNLGLDQDVKIKYSTSLGRNLGEKGVFWSYNNPPKAAEVSAAVLRMKTHYADLLERVEAAQLRSNSVVDELTPEHHEAAEYFKEVTPWHPVIRG